MCLYARWNRCGTFLITSAEDLPETEEADNEGGFDVLATASTQTGGNYADIVYSVSIVWSVDSASLLQLAGNNVYTWNPDTLQYEKNADGKPNDFVLKEEFSLDLSILISNRSNAEVGYSILFDAEQATDGLVCEEQADILSEPGGTVASADTNAVGTSAPNSGHAYVVDSERVDNAGAQQEVFYSATLTVTAFHSQENIEDLDSVTLGVYTVTLSA